jgi:hypothetical protein
MADDDVKKRVKRQRFNSTVNVEENEPEFEDDDDAESETSGSSCDDDCCDASSCDCSSYNGNDDEEYEADDDEDHDDDDEASYETATSQEDTAGDTPAPPPAQDTEEQASDPVATVQEILAIDMKETVYKPTFEARKAGKYSLRGQPAQAVDPYCSNPEVIQEELRQRNILRKSPYIKQLKHWAVVLPAVFSHWQAQVGTSGSGEPLYARSLTVPKRNASEYTYLHSFVNVPTLSSSMNSIRTEWMHWMEYKKVTPPQITDDRVAAREHALDAEVTEWQQRQEEKKASGQVDDEDSDAESSVEAELTDTEDDDDSEADDESDIE